MSRPPSARAQREEGLGAEIERIFHDRQLGRGPAGVRKMWRLMQRDPQIIERFVPVARCTVERLRRGRGFARAAPRQAGGHHPPGKATASRAPDHLVKRNFHRQRPDQLWVGTSGLVDVSRGTVGSAE